MTDQSLNFPMTRTIRVFDREVKIKNYICRQDDGEYLEKPENPKIQLTIVPTDYCGCNCLFCSAKNLGITGDRTSGAGFDTGRLSEVLKELGKRNLVRGISITGGEPFTDITLLDDIISLCFEILGEGMEISINTNGSGLDDIHRIRKLGLVDAIHISRHHYDEAANAALFAGGDTARAADTGIPTNERLKEILKGVAYKDLFVFNCLLLKDFIGSREEVHRFLDFAIETGVRKTGFVTAMEVNDFTRRQRVSFKDVLKRDDPQLLFTRCFRDFDTCCCQDGVYSSKNGGLCEFYGRQTMPGTLDYARALVYGADNHLRTGYTGEIIV